jgi:transcriptional regulator with XRE-family HTH domain
MARMPPLSAPDLGSFLRARRGRLRPPAPRGLSVSRRQVPGLRRQELAEDAGISVEYYTRLEQGRAPRPSREVLLALARALQLAPAARAHLFRLAGEVPPEPDAPDSSIRPGLAGMLAGLGDAVPVTVHDGRLEVLARNRAAAEMLGPLPPGPHGRNIVQHAFLPGARQTLGDEGTEAYAAWAVAELRSSVARYPEDARLRGLVAHLAVSSAPFRELWARGEVGGERSGLKRVHHPARGWLRFQSEMLHDPERDHWVVIYAPAD